MDNVRCNCGFANIPQDAQFCPGCGRPLTADALETDRQRNGRGQRPAARESQSLPISLGNPHALRACYWSGAAAALLTGLPYMSLLFFVWFPAAGFFSAASYRRRSGQPLTVKSGAKLGWLTGVIAFAISLLLWAISSFLPGSASFSAGIVTMQEQFAANGQEELARQLGALLENSAALAILFLLALICTFGIIASCTTAGGALGGRILRKR